MADIDPTVAKIQQRIKPGQDEHRTRIKSYDKFYDIYRATRPNSRSRAPYESDIRAPYAKQVIDTGLVNIVSGIPKVIVRPRHPQWALAAKAMQYLLDYHIHEDHFVEKQPVFAQQALIFGTTVAKNHWLYQKRTKKTRDLQTGQMVDTEFVVRDGPTFEPWSVYRCYWSPGARSADDAEYVVLQTYLSKDELLRNRFDPDSGSGRYQNLDQLFAMGQGREPGSTAQENYLGLADSRVKGKFLIEEIWTDEALIVIGNGQVLLRAAENPYWHGKKPIVVAQVMPDLFELQGISDAEAINDLQQALWTVSNLRMDNLKLTVHRGVTYREGGVTDPDALELRPRFKWPVSDHDDINFPNIPPLPPDAYREEEALLGRMQLISGINPYVSGSDLATVDQNTATGVTALQEVASRLLRFKASQLHYKGYLRSFEMWGDMLQQFLDKSEAVEIVGPGNDAQWVEIAPQDIAGHFRYSLEGSEESLSRQQERGEAIALLNAFAPLAQAVPINWPALLERVASAYNFPNPEALFLRQQQPPPPAAPNVLGAQIGPGAGPLDQPPLDPRLAQALQATPFARFVQGG